MIDGKPAFSHNDTMGARPSTWSLTAAQTERGPMYYFSTKDTQLTDIRDLKKHVITDLSPYEELTLINKMTVAPVSYLSSEPSRYAIWINDTYPIVYKNSYVYIGDGHQFSGENRTVDLHIDYSGVGRREGGSYQGYFHPLFTSAFPRIYQGGYLSLFNISDNFLDWSRGRLGVMLLCSSIKNDGGCDLHHRYEIHYLPFS